MKQVYLLRHGEKDSEGVLTENGKSTAALMRTKLPRFTHIISSDSERTILTARLMTGKDPEVDHRAAYATTSSAISAEINSIAKEHSLSFLDAARRYNDPNVLLGIDEQAHTLNSIIDELLAKLAENEKALIVSHDLTITPAMGFRGMPAESIGPLSGYVICLDNGAISVQQYSPLD